VSFLLGDSTTRKTFMDSLDDQALQVYKDIYNRRLSVYLVGGILGCLSCIFLAYVGFPNMQNDVCTQGLTIMLVQRVYYLLSPYPEKMDDYLISDQQRLLWNNTKKEMERRTLIASVVSVIASLVAL